MSRLTEFSHETIVRFFSRMSWWDFLCRLYGQAQEFALVYKVSYFKAHFISIFGIFFSTIWIFLYS